MAYCDCGEETELFQWPRGCCGCCPLCEHCIKDPDDFDADELGLDPEDRFDA